MTIAARRAAVAVACWSAASLLMFLVNDLDVQLRPRPLPFAVPWTRVLFVSVLSTALWALLTVPILATRAQFRTACTRFR